MHYTYASRMKPQLSAHGHGKCEKSYHGIRYRRDEVVLLVIRQQIWFKAGTTFKDAWLHERPHASTNRCAIHWKEMGTHKRDLGKRIQGVCMTEFRGVLKEVNDLDSLASELVFFLSPICKVATEVFRKRFGEPGMIAKFDEYSHGTCNRAVALYTRQEG